MIALPRNITRSAFQQMRHHERQICSREGRNLPDHPANGWITCPECEGEGEVDIVWVAEDDYTCRPCPRCEGEGDLLDGHEDPLVALRRARMQLRWLSSFPHYSPGARRLILSHRYSNARAKAMERAHGVAHAERLYLDRTFLIRARAAA